VRVIYPQTIYIYVKNDSNLTLARDFNRRGKFFSSRKILRDGRRLIPIGSAPQGQLLWQVSKFDELIMCFVWRGRPFCSVLFENFRVLLVFFKNSFLPNFCVFTVSYRSPNKPSRLSDFDVFFCY